MAAPSANISSRLSPVCSKDVREDFKEIKFILEGGRSSIGIEFTIIDIRNEPKILRLGGIEVKTIQKILNRKIIVNNSPAKISAPGQSKIHYSPGIPIRLKAKKSKNKKLFYLLIKRKTQIKLLFFIKKRKSR